MAIDFSNNSRILDHGTHMGFEWYVLYNFTGHRCGYVQIPVGHPWYEKDYEEIECSVHGSLTYGDVSPDGKFYVGFDCAHFGDLPDFDLPFGDDPDSPECQTARKLIMDCHERSIGILGRDHRMTIKGTDYVKKECIELCEQAAQAITVA
jgi:hypothetical protein